MAEVQIIYWRDIPAQVLSGRGRKAVKAPLPERFEKAIDRAAMISGANETDAYLSEWRRCAPYSIDGSDADAVAIEVDRLDNEYNNERLKDLIANNGHSIGCP